MSDTGQGYIGFPVEEHDDTPFWSIEGLWRASADLPAVALPVASFSHVLDEPQAWFAGGTPTLRELAEQARRIYGADLAYPIILSAEGQLMDGKHRLAKAFLLGYSEINAVQFTANPTPDFWHSMAAEPEPNG